MPMDPKPRSRPIRWGYAALAYLFVGLAMVGVVLPGLPTVPFLLLAAWAAARGSRRVHDWLHEHPRFGRDIRAWRDQRAVSTRAKITAVAMLILSWLIMLWRVGEPAVLIGLALLFIAVSSYLVTRPTPVPPDADEASGV